MGSCLSEVKHDQDDLTLSALFVPTAPLGTSNIIPGSASVVIPDGWGNFLASGFDLVLDNLLTVNVGGYSSISLSGVNGRLNFSDSTSLFGLTVANKDNTMFLSATVDFEPSKFFNLPQFTLDCAGTYKPKIENYDYPPGTTQDDWVKKLKSYGPSISVPFSIQSDPLFKVGGIVPIAPGMVFCRWAYSLSAIASYKLEATTEHVVVARSYSLNLGLRPVFLPRTPVLPPIPRPPAPPTPPDPPAPQPEPPLQPVPPPPEPPTPPIQPSPPTPMPPPDPDFPPALPPSGPTAPKYYWRDWLRQLQKELEEAEAAKKAIAEYIASLAAYVRLTKVQVEKDQDLEQRLRDESKAAEEASKAAAIAAASALGIAEAASGVAAAFLECNPFADAAEVAAWASYGAAAAAASSAAYAATSAAALLASWIKHEIDAGDKAKWQYAVESYKSFAPALTTYSNYINSLQDLVQENYMTFHAQTEYNLCLESASDWDGLVGIDVNFTTVFGKFLQASGSGGVKAVVQVGEEGRETWTVGKGVFPGSVTFFNKWDRLYLCIRNDGGVESGYSAVDTLSSFYLEPTGNGLKIKTSWAEYICAMWNDTFQSSPSPTPDMHPDFWIPQIPKIDYIMLQGQTAQGTQVGQAMVLSNSDEDIHKDPTSFEKNIKAAQTTALVQGWGGFVVELGSDGKRTAYFRQDAPSALLQNMQATTSSSHMLFVAKLNLSLEVMQKRTVITEIDKPSKLTGSWKAGNGDVHVILQTGKTVTISGGPDDPTAAISGTVSGDTITTATSRGSATLTQDTQHGAILTWTNGDLWTQVE